MKRILAWILMLCLLCGGCVALADDDEYEGGDPPLAPDLYLHGNPTTGYQWTYTVSEPSVVTVTDNGYAVDNEELMGSPGVYSFRLDGLKEGAAEIAFTYAGPSGELACTLTYNVSVDDDGDVTIYGSELKLG